MSNGNDNTSIDDVIEILSQYCQNFKIALDNMNTSIQTISIKRKSLAIINEMYVELRKTSPSQVWYKETLIKNALDRIYLMYTYAESTTTINPTGGTTTEINNVANIPEKVRATLEPYLNDILLNTVGRTVEMKADKYIVSARPVAKAAIKAAAKAAIEKTELPADIKTAAITAAETAIDEAELPLDQKAAETAAITAAETAIETAIDEAELPLDQKASIKTKVKTTVKTAITTLYKPPEDQPEEPEEQEEENDG